MPHNRRLCLGPFGEVHNSRDLLAPRRPSSLLAKKTKTPRCPLMTSGYASKLRLFTWIQLSSGKYRIKPLQPFIKLSACIRWCGRDPPSSGSVSRSYRSPGEQINRSHLSFILFWMAVDFVLALPEFAEHKLFKLPSYCRDAWALRIRPAHAEHLSVCSRDLTTPVPGLS